MQFIVLFFQINKNVYPHRNQYIFEVFKYKYFLSKLIYLTTATLLNIYNHLYRYTIIYAQYYKIIIMQVHRLILKLNRFLF